MNAGIVLVAPIACSRTRPADSPPGWIRRRRLRVAAGAAVQVHRRSEALGDLLRLPRNPAWPAVKNASSLAVNPASGVATGLAGSASGPRTPGSRTVVENWDCDTASSTWKKIPTATSANAKNKEGKTFFIVVLSSLGHALTRWSGHGATYFRTEGRVQRYFVISRIAIGARAATEGQHARESANFSGAIRRSSPQTDYGDAIR